MGIGSIEAKDSRPAEEVFETDNLQGRISVALAELAAVEEHPYAKYALTSMAAEGLKTVPMGERKQAGKMFREALLNGSDLPKAATPDV